MSELFNIINISGPDSYKFLQGQITANLDDLNIATNKQILSAYCNLKGRVIAVFYISKKTDNDYEFLFLGDTAEIFIKKIKKYSIFSKVIFSDVKPIPNNLNLNIEFLIQNKIPIITSTTSELFLPDNINLIDLNAVSFKKGCFLGQEIIARMYYKGKTKQKLYLIKSDVNFNSSPDKNISGENILLQDHITIAGQLVYSHKNIGYAVIEDRFLGEELFVGKERIFAEG